MTDRPAIPHRRLGDAILRAGLLAAIWWMVTQGAASSWIIGVPTVAAATAVSLVLVPRLALPRLSAIPAFALFFLRESVRGGYDVTRRAFHPDVPLEPDFVTVSVAELGRAQRLFFLIVLSLLPGTLSCRLEGDRLLVHVLDRNLDISETLDTLTRRIAQLDPARDGTTGERDE